jgi:hypothetical protein
MALLKFKIAMADLNPYGCVMPGMFMEPQQSPCVSYFVSKLFRGADSNKLCYPTGLVVDRSSTLLCSGSVRVMMLGIIY